MWTDPAVTLPSDAQTVYVRQKLYSIQTPLDAVFHTATNTFTMPNGLELDWYFVASWKPR